MVANELRACREAGVVPGLVHVVDDDASFLTAMKRSLERAGYEVAIYVSAQHLLDRLPHESVPSCILLDVRIPGMDGPALQKRLKELGSTVPIIFVSGHVDIPVTVRALKEGAENFLTKPVTSDGFLTAIERAFARHRAFREQQTKLDVVRTLIAKLTRRERQVFQLIVVGKTNKQIASILGTTERTIKAHRHGVMEKTQVRTLAELVALAERAGVVGDMPNEVHMA